MLLAAAVYEIKVGSSEPNVVCVFLCVSGAELSVDDGDSDWIQWRRTRRRRV